MYCCSPCPQPCSRPPPTHVSAGDSWTPTGKSGTVSCGVTAPFSWVLVHKVLLCPPSVYFPVLCKFWQLYSAVNGDFLQESLCHTQDCCTLSPCPCGRPPPICTSTGDTQTQFWHSLCGVAGSWCTQGLFEPSERLWWEWGLILNANLPLLPSCWGFSPALGRGVSPCGPSSEAQPPLLTLDLGYLLMAATPDPGPFTSQILHPSFTSQMFPCGTLLGCKTLEALKKKNGQFEVLVLY